MNNRIGTFVSLVINMNNPNASQHFFERMKELSEYMANEFTDYEFIIINDYINDYDFTKLLNDISSIRILDVTPNLNEDVKLTIGIENAVGERVIFFNPLNDTLSLIKESVELTNKGYDLVTGVDNSGLSTTAYRVVRKLSEPLLKKVGYRVPKNATTFKCLTRNTADLVTKSLSRHQQFNLRLYNSSLKATTIEHSRSGGKIKTLSSRVLRINEVLISNSTLPLRWITILGIFGSAISFFIGAYGFLSAFLNDEIADGWASLTMLNSMMFMVLLFILSFFSQYLIRIMDEQSNHDLYWISRERHSSIMLKEDRINVLDFSE